MKLDDLHDSYSSMSLSSPPLNGQSSSYYNFSHDALSREDADANVSFSLTRWWIASRAVTTG